MIANTKLKNKYKNVTQCSLLEVYPRFRGTEEQSYIRIHRHENLNSYQITNGIWPYLRW